MPTFKVKAIIQFECECTYTVSAKTAEDASNAVNESPRDYDDRGHETMVWVEDIVSVEKVRSAKAKAPVTRR